MDPDRLPRPTKEQQAWHDNDLSMFVHIAPDVWRSRLLPWRFVPPRKINPSGLDTDQWARVVVSLGAKRLIFVAKHERGFCWWQTETSAYGIKETPWKGGKGDVVAEVAASCRKHGLQLGIYLSPADRFLGARVGGVCPSPEDQRRYDAVYRAQLTELLTRCGEVVEIWFDGSLVVDVKDIVAAHAPHAIIFQGPLASIRWVGNESGHAPYPGWNGLKRADAATGIATAAQGDPDGDAWLPLEVDTPIRHHLWFWKPKSELMIKSLEHLMEVYYRSVGHGAVLLLNGAPDRTGRIPERDAARTAEFGAEIQRRFGKPLAETRGQGKMVTLELDAPSLVDHVVIMEDISKGERVREYAVEGERGGTWFELVRGTAIGHKKIEFFQETEVTKLRLNVSRSVGDPIVRSLAAYHVGSVPSFDRYKIHVWNGLSAGSWNDLAAVGWTTLEFKIADQCKEAAQYGLEIAPARTDPVPPPIEVKSVTLLHDGVATDGFVSPGKEPLHYLLNITGFNQKLAVRLEMRKTTGDTSPGSLIIRRLH